METQSTTERLEYLRGQIRAECISMGELVELQGMADQIDPGDVELLEWAGVPEFPEAEELAFGRAFIGLDGLRELREQINEALRGW